MLPTARPVDSIDGIKVTLIDNGMPIVVIRAGDLGVRGDESPQILESSTGLIAAKESIRLQAGELMGLGDVAEKSVPKVCLVSKPQQGGNLSTRTFIPHACHNSIGVLGAASVATACLVPGSIAEGLVKIPGENPDGSIDFTVEHPSGSFQLRINSSREQGELQVLSIGVLRTARMLFQGQIFIPQTIWQGSKSELRV
jgi:4-oxalomesaconate tautomerase